VTAPPGEADRIRRHLLIVGVADYRPGWDDIRDGVLAETAKAESLFLDTFGYERETFRRIADTTRTGISDGIASWLESIAGSPNDLVTIYHSGHGIVDRSIFRLVTSEIETNRTALALSLTDLVPIIWTGDRNVLLILDTCHSGTTGG